MADDLDPTAVERAARALFDFTEPTSHSWETTDQATRNRWLTRAHAALTAARAGDADEQQARMDDYASGRWCGLCRHGVVEDPPCCTPCPCCGGTGGEHRPVALTVSAKRLREAWESESVAYLKVEDPNGPEFGVAHIPFGPWDRMLRTLETLGIEVTP